MPLLNFFFWFMLAVLAGAIYALLGRLKRQEAADLAYLARLTMVWQDNEENQGTNKKAAG